MTGRHIAFSSDGKRFVLCEKEAPTVRDSGSCQTIATLCSPGRGFSCCCFSPDGEFVAAAAESTVFVWIIASTHPTPPRLIGSFDTHGINTKITTLLYSSSVLISAHGDHKIRFWQVDGGSQDPTTVNAKSTAFAVQADVTYITLQAKEGVAIIVDSTGTVILWDLSTGHPNTLLPLYVFELPVRCARLVDGKLITVHCNMFTVHHNAAIYEHLGRWGISTWDAEGGKMLRKTPPFVGPYTDDPVISEDGTKLVLVDWRTIQTWCTSTGQNLGQVEHGRNSRIIPILRGPTVWIVLEGSPILGWDLDNLMSLPLDSYDIPNKRRFSLTDRKGNFRGSTPFTVRDAASDTVVFRPSAQFTRPTARVEFDGRYLVAVYKSGEVLILDFVHMVPQ